jgi:hypothetical protein
MATQQQRAPNPSNPSSMTRPENTTVAPSTYSSMYTTRFGHQVQSFVRSIFSPTQPTGSTGPTGGFWKRLDRVNILVHCIVLLILPLTQGSW